MKDRHSAHFNSYETIRDGFRELGYIASRQIATTVFLAYNLGKPIIVEGPAGVGKTELAKVTAQYLSLPLIRLQCYEGLDESKALYEWKYGKQLLYTQLLKDKMDDIIKRENCFQESLTKLHDYDDIFFSWPFLEQRPLLKALQQPEGAVLLVDEVDKADEEFEAFLLEILSDFQVSIPEIGTVQAVEKPFVFLTSNNTRELSEALKRRCVHLFIPFPDARLERDIVRARVPEVSERLAKQLVSFIQAVRTMEIKKVPSISETIDWARAILLLNASELSRDVVRDTLNIFMKFEDDLKLIDENIPSLTAGALKASGQG